MSINLFALRFAQMDIEVTLLHENVNNNIYLITCKILILYIYFKY